MAAFVFGGLMAAGSLIAAPAETTGSTKELAQKLRTLATANAVHSLSSKEAARAFPVHLRAVVTFFDPKVGAHRTGFSFTTQREAFLWNFRRACSSRCQPDRWSI
jgi:hypothetical protein